MSKRIQSFGILCIVISMALCPFLSVFAGVDGTSLTDSAYMPVCPYYYSAENLPFGDDTAVIYFAPNGNVNRFWYFIDMGTDDSVQSTNFGFPITGFYVDDLDSSGTVLTYWRGVIYSASKIIRVTVNSSTGAVSVGRYGSITTYDASNPSMDMFRYKYISNFHDKGSYLGTLICTQSYNYNGHDLHYYIDRGSPDWGTVDNYYSPYYIASYPDTVQHAIESIQGNTTLLNSYYSTLNSKLNSLSIDVQYIQGQNDELSSKVDELQSQLGSQSSEYQSALATAQSQIESNAQSAAQSAADDINNAGEDVSDIDDDMDDVNSIVETLDGWIDSLDTFADTIDDTAGDVADALDNASDFVEGFIGACPAIVIALFSFALVFLIVRKIIGR